MKAILLVGSMLGMLAAAPTYAYFEVKGNQASNGGTAAGQLEPGYQLVADRSQPPLLTQGTPQPGVDRQAGGFGDGVPFGTALQMLLPSGWKAQSSAAINMQQKVRWSQAPRWTDALQQIATQTNTSIVVNYDYSLVTINGLPGTGSAPGGLAAQVAQDATIGAQVAANGGTGPANTTAFAGTSTAAQVEPVKPITIDQFNTQKVRADLPDATLEQAIAALLPPGWHVDMDVPVDVSNGTFKVNADGPRAEALGRIAQAAGVAIRTYPDLNKVVVSAQ